MKDYLESLAEAISDVGCWRWWDATFPKLFQVEFGGTQLWSPPLKAGGPPSGILALRFREPKSVSFLTHKDHLSHWPADWPDQLHGNLLDALTLQPGAFTFSDEAHVRQMISSAGRIDSRFGLTPGQDAFAALPARLGFWAGAVGSIVGAESMELYNFQGRVSPEQIPEMNAKWWAYWREYWRVKDTPHALPVDYACEVTIPASPEE